MKVAIFALGLVASAGVGGAQTGPDGAVVRASLGALDALNTGRAQDVYDALSAQTRAAISAAAFAEPWDRAAADYGGPVSGGIAQVTWYDDPQGADQLAAADYGLRFGSDHLACGYVLWSVTSDGALGDIRRFEVTWLPPEMVLLERDAFVAAFQSTPCRALPSGILEAQE